VLRGWPSPLRFERITVSQDFSPRCSIDTDGSGIGGICVLLHFSPPVAKLALICSKDLNEIRMSKWSSRFTGGRIGKWDPLEGECSGVDADG
jgi:hypothetical protein